MMLKSLQALAGRGLLAIRIRMTEIALQDLVSLEIDLADTDLRARRDRRCELVARRLLTLRQRYRDRYGKPGDGATFRVA